MAVDFGAVFYREANPNKSIPGTGCGLIVQGVLASSDPRIFHPFIMPNTHSDVLIYSRDDRFPDQNRSVIKRFACIVRPAGTTNGHGLVEQPPLWDDPASTTEVGIEKVLGIYYFGRTYLRHHATTEDLIQEMIQEPVESQTAIEWADLMAGCLLSDDQYLMPWLQNLMHKDTGLYDVYRFEALCFIREAIHNDDILNGHDDIVRMYEASLEEFRDGQPCVVAIRTARRKEDADVVIPLAHLHRRLT